MVLFWILLISIFLVKDTIGLTVFSMELVFVGLRYLYTICWPSISKLKTFFKLHLTVCIRKSQFFGRQRTYIYFFLFAVDYLKTWIKERTQMLLNYVSTRLFSFQLVVSVKIFNLAFSHVMKLVSCLLYIFYTSICCVSHLGDI